MREDIYNTAVVALFTVKECMSMLFVLVLPRSRQELRKRKKAMDEENGESKNRWSGNHIFNARFTPTATTPMTTTRRRRQARRCSTTSVRTSL